MVKQAVTFRLDAELVKRLKDTAAKSGGKLSQAEIVESALADRFAVKDGTKLLAKVNQDQATAVTLVKEQSAALEAFKDQVRAGITNYTQRMHQEVAQLQSATDQKLSDNTASIRTMQNQMSAMEMTMRQVEHVMGQAAEGRLGVLHWLGLVGLVALALIGVAALSLFMWQRFIG